ncbi:Methyl esterase 17 [Hibiscus syriacus]|uniref:Methyl esterase 17 n=1 Tax=Hibiscus syriacus TaxID=106335 RepID=A0A6A2Z680_HIBSY|nr:Methyl esterase 17 [Hibiscus syriacus]
MNAILKKDGCLAAINEKLIDFADDIKWNEMDGNAMTNFHLALVDEGHLKKDCWSLNKNSNPQGNTANTSDDGDALCCEASTTVEGRKKFADIWLIDSGATYHMTSRKEWFHHYEPVSGGSVYSCNDHALDIVGVRTIKLKMYDGTIKVVRDVRHVKGLKKNLLSYELLDNNASKIETQKGIMKVSREALVVLKGEKITTNLYMLKGETLLEAEASVASCSSDSAMLRHKKLGHMSEQGMKVLVEQKLLPSLTKVSLPLCEHCITSKQHRLKFNTSNSIGKSVLELVHSDVWQAPVTSLDGAKYFVSFIDDYSRRCWVYPIKKKSDVFATFKNFKARVELDSGNKIKCFRTDNGGEYTSEEFDDFCKRECIKRQDAGLEKSFWAEAVNTACYLVNRALLTAIELKTPMETWIGKPVDYSNLHVFGSIVYVMYNSQEISKLDPKSRKCKFLGYANGVKGYRLWDPTARKVIISRDVIFVEDKLQRKEYNDNTEKSETTQIHVEKKVEQGDYSEAELAHDEQELESSEAPTTRQSNRMRRRPNWHSDYVIEGNIAYYLLTEDGEPLTYQEAINSSDVSLWMMAMQEEIEALHKNNTWDLVPLPQGRKPIGNKWVFKIKRNGDDQVERYRARLVVKGYAQKEGIDFNEIFSPVVRLTTVRVVLAMCATLNIHLEQLDVKTTFLHGNLEEEIYMLQPEGFEEKEKKNLVCRLNKSLYGLKQAPRCWYKRFDSFIMCLGYNRLNAYPCAYFKRSGDNNFVILLLYVDGMLVAGPNKDHIEELKAQLAREFEMKDLGSANKILGMQIHRDRSNRKIWLSQKNYLKKILSRFNMQDCKSISTPLPINFKLSSSMSPSSEEERMEMSRVPDLDKSKSTTGYVFKVAGGAVSWVSKLQSVVATSTIEAEYVAATQASKEAIWLKMLFEELGHNQEYVSLFCDSQSILHLARNLAFHSRTKHIRVQYHFIREKVEEGTVDMQKIHTKDNIADFITKAINADKFTWCRSSCGLSETQTEVNTNKVDSEGMNSCWWDSHLNPENSGWLAGNFKGKQPTFEVNAFMIKYEVIDQVQELRRIYQSLAERYDHLNGELRKSVPSDFLTQGPDGGLDQNSPMVTPDKKMGIPNSSVNIYLSSVMDADNRVEHHKIIEHGSELPTMTEKIQVVDGENADEEEIERLNAELKKSEFVSVLAENMTVQLESLLRDMKIREAELELEKGKVVELEAHVSDSNSEASRLMDELAGSKEKINALEEEITMLKHELGKKVSDDAHHVPGRLESSQEEIARLKAQLDREEAGCELTGADFESETFGLLEKDTHLEAILKEWELHGRLLEEKLRQCETEKMETKGLNDVQETMLQGQISQLRAEVKAKAVHVEALTKDLDKVKLKYDMLTAEKDGVTAKANTLVAEVRSRDSLIRQMEEHLQQLSREHRQLISGSKHAKNVEDELKLRIKDLEKEVN